MTITVSDVTLRDGWHMFDYHIPIDFIDTYSKFAERAGIDVLEVGHGLSIVCTNPSINLTDIEMLQVARKNLIKTRLSTLVNPDYCSLDYAASVTREVDIIRLSCIPTETEKIKEFARYFVDKKDVWVSLLFTSKFTDNQVMHACTEISKMGVKSIVIFDTTGNYKPEVVQKRISDIKTLLPDLAIGFHGHNNLQLAIANSLAATYAGASIVDVSLHGIGGGSGNAQLEIFASLCETNTDLVEIYKMNDEIEHFPSRKTDHIRNAIANYSPFFKSLGGDPGPYI